jgi:tripartite-type tricarboxylate transporter receptor subunit TctC
MTRYLPFLDASPASWLRRSALALFCVAALGAGSAAAQFPERPIRIVVPYPPGGGTDAVARALAPRFGEELGAPVFIENKPGASSTVGLDAVAKSRPDGYTVGIVNIAFVANPSLLKSVPFDAVKDLAPISMVTTLPLVVAIHPSVPARSVKEFIALAKSKPDLLFYGSAGNGTSNHLLTERFKSITGIKMTHVPYKGGAPSVLGLINGETSMLMASPSSAIQFFQSGKLVPIATGGASRLEILPDVPTIAETVPGFEAIDFTGVVAPAGTPPAIIEKMHRALVKALAAPDVKERLISSGAQPAGTSPQEFSAFIKKELATWAQVVREVGITVD